MGQYRLESESIEMKDEILDILGFVRIRHLYQETSFSELQGIGSISTLETAVYSGIYHMLSGHTAGNTGR